jgi:hypothetical protein
MTRFAQHLCEAVPEARVRQSRVRGDTVVGRNGARAALIVVLALTAIAGCGGGGSSKSESPTGSSEPTDATIPLAKDSPTTKLFTALNSFNACLKTKGTQFIGIPDATNPQSPTNDPTYLANLTTCAARSNIQQVSADAQKAQDNLTPEQIKKSNEGFLVWRDCMISRGWGMPEPKPDEKGRLFSFGGGNSLPPFQPPAGENIVSTDDYQKCASEVLKTNPEAFPSS